MPSLEPDLYRQRLAGKSTAEIFTPIYEKKLWGGRLTRGYHSGSGSRDPELILPYVSAIGRLLTELGHPSVVDLGCGDFEVGKRLVDHASSFIGCDIVRPVIEANRCKYPDIDFRVIDAVEDELPVADVILVRQVLQHLSNDQIARILPKLKQFKVAVITEHLPNESFITNQDKSPGPDHRGVILTEPPFSFRAKTIQTICEVREFSGIIRTTAFTFD